MAKIETNKVARYKGKYPLNMATKAAKLIRKKAGEEFTAAEVAAIEDDTFESMVKSGDVVVTDKPKSTPQKDGDK